MTKEISVLKNQVRRLHKHLSATVLDLSYSQCLEAVAALHGFANWRTLQASAGENPPQKTAIIGVRNIFDCHFHEGPAGDLVISQIAIQDKAGEDQYYWYKDLHYVEQDYIELLAEETAALAAGKPVDSQVLTDLEECLEALVLDWGDEIEGEGLTVGELRGIQQISPTRYQLKDGRKLEFLYTRAISINQVCVPIAAPEAKALASSSGKSATQTVFLLENQFETLHYDNESDSGFIIRCENLAENVWKAEEWLNGDIVDNGYFDHYDKALAWVSQEVAGHMERRKNIASELPAAAAESFKRQPRYVIAENWGHLFGPGESERDVRFVFDRADNKIVFLQVSNSVNGWQNADARQVADVEDSLKNGNEDAIDNPGNWGIDESDELPDWAQK